MYERKIPINIECGIEITMLVMGGKWKPWLLEHINLGFRRPIDLEKKIDKASRRVLNQQLSEMENMGIVRKEVFNETPMRVEYYLTPLGESLIPLIRVMDNWGETHREEVLRIYQSE